MRSAAIRLVRWRWFDWFILASIAANCITLAMGSNRPGFEVTELAQRLKPLEYLFLGIFTMEMLVKWLALGVIGSPGTYFRNGEPHNKPYNSSCDAASRHCKQGAIAPPPQSMLPAPAKLLAVA